MTNIKLLKHLLFFLITFILSFSVSALLIILFKKEYNDFNVFSCTFLIMFFIYAFFGLLSYLNNLDEFERILNKTVLK